MTLKRICVFCGSSPGVRPEYAAAARRLGGLLAERKIGLVFGGGKVGMMGQLAQAALENGGEVIGVIPRQLHEKKVAFTGLADLRVVNTMHERKMLMAELADGFVALPGGLGTLEEIFEILTWAQLGTARQALRPAQCRRLLHAAARFPRPGHRRGLPGRGAPRHDHDRRASGRTARAI